MFAEQISGLLLSIAHQLDIPKNPPPKDDFTAEMLAMVSQLQSTFSKEHPPEKIDQGNSYAGNSIRFDVNQSELEKAVNLLYQLHDRKLYHPVLGYMRLTINDHDITLSATNLRFWCDVQVLAHKRSPVAGVFLLPIKAMRDFLAKGKNKTSTIVRVEHSGEYMSFGIGDRALRISANDIPEVSEMPDVAALGSLDKAIHSLTLRAEDLLLGMEKTSFATAKEETKGNLTMVNLKVESRQINFAATDGHRLSHYRIAYFPEKEVETFDFCIPFSLKFLTQVCKSDIVATLNYYKGDEKENTAADKLEIVCGNVRAIATTYLLGQRYPAYQTLFPSIVSALWTIKVDRLKLIELISSSTESSNLKTDKIFITYKDNCTLEVRRGIDHFYATIHSIHSMKGGDKVVFNFKYLLEALKAGSSKQIAFYAFSGGDKTRVYLVSIIDGQLAQLICPVEIKEE